MPWFADIKKTALITCVAATLTILIAGWRGAEELALTNPVSKWWLVSIAVLVYLLGATMPVFYFALYRNEGTLRFPRHLRLLSLVTVLVYGLTVTIDLSEWAGSLGPYWRAMKALDWGSGATSVLTALRDPRSIRHLSTLLAEFGNLTYMLLLIAFWRREGDESHTESDVPVSRLLSSVTKVALIVWGLWVVFNLVRLVLTPYTYFQLRNSALEIGRSSPPLGAMMANAIRTLLSQACLFIAPYIVYNGWMRRDEELG